MSRSWSPLILAAGLLAIVSSATAQPRQDDDLPALVRLQPREFRQTWRELDAVIREGKKLPRELPEPYFARARLWTRAGDRDAALQDYLTAVNLVAQQGQDLTSFTKYFPTLSEGLAALDAVLPSPVLLGRGLAAFAAGREAFQNGDLSAALKSLSDAVALEPDEPIYWYYRALTHKRLGQQRRAVHDARVAAYLETRPEADAATSPSVSRWLEPLQQDLRDWLQAFRDGDPTAHDRELEADEQRRLHVLFATTPTRPGDDDEGLPPLVRKQPDAIRRGWKEVDQLLADAQSDSQQAAVQAITSLAMPSTAAGFSQLLALRQSQEQTALVPELYLVRAGLAAEIHDHNRALSDYLQAMAQPVPPGRSVIVYAKYFQILRQCLDRLDRVPRPLNYGTAERHTAKGALALEAGDAKTALAHFDLALWLDSSEPVHWYHRALTHKRLGNDTAARRDVQMGMKVEQAPRVATTLRPRAAYYQQPSLALERFQGSLRDWLQDVRGGAVLSTEY
jgi:tetratricopeptide (TPR) repeat protein